MEELKELKELVKKELKEVGTKGLSSANLESTYKLTDILKDLLEIESEKKEMTQQQQGGSYGMLMPPPYMPPTYRGYGEGGYNERGGSGYNERGGGYNERGGGYNEGGYGEGYSARGGRGGGRSYNGYDNRMRDRIDRVIDGAEIYEYGRDRYQHGGSQEAMEEGLEKMMYAVCMLVETAMDAAQSPKEKEIIRKHIQKIKAL